jgi:hypothetical protein
MGEDVCVGGPGSKYIGTCCTFPSILLWTWNRNWSFGPQARPPGLLHVMSGHSPPYAKQRDMVKGRERRFIMQPIFKHLQGIDMNYRLKLTKNWCRGGEECLIKQSWSKCSLIDYYLSSGSVGFWRSCCCCHHLTYLWSPWDKYFCSRVQSCHYR